MTNTLREKVAEIIGDVFESGANGGGGYDADFEYADRILALPEIAGALACYTGGSITQEIKLGLRDAPHSQD